MLFRIFMVVVALGLPNIARSDDDGQCFLPDGSKDNNDLPCFSNDVGSRCCAPDESCSTNRLCVKTKDDSDLRFARGSCLDKNFGSTCPTFCKGINDNGKVDLLQCGDPSLGQFCCDEGDGYACCSTPSKVLTLGVGSTFAEGAKSTIMSSMSKTPQAKTSSSRETSTSNPETSTLIRTETSVQVATSVQIRTTVQTQTSVEAQTSLQVQTSAQIITSTQIQTSDQLVTSVQVQTSVQTSVIVVTSVAQQSSVSTQSPALSLSTHLSAATQPPSTSILQPSTSLLPSSSSILSSSTSFLQPSTSILSPTSTSPLLASAASIVQGPPTSTSQVDASPIAASEFGSLSTGTSLPNSPSQTTAAAAAISATLNATASEGTSAATIIIPILLTLIILAGLLIAGLLFSKRRAEKRASAEFEESLGKTNFGFEKGGFGGDEKSGFPFGRSESRGSESNYGDSVDNGAPVANRSVSPSEIGRVASPVEMAGSESYYSGPHNRYSGRKSSMAMPPGVNKLPEQGIQRRFTGDGNASPYRPVSATSQNRNPIPLRGLEKRISSGTFEGMQRPENEKRPELGATVRSETFEKLLYDVQSQPF